ncbi:hypothetical protein B9Z55_012635 [Caenorhabditis nigoni]|uniref:CXXC-type domain-containing protein n=1 Tax=Caenorhabditis nigoni TaxID=1611254 RepID=A0A2G5TYP5_9PELO|nr:hypothetical protein B9Z55_012635 [Caenorhabditis nigoni]
MSGTSTKESSEDNEDVWRHRCFKCIRCNERDDCKVCWPCKSGRTCDKRRCFSAKKLYEESCKEQREFGAQKCKISLKIGKIPMKMNKKKSKFWDFCSKILNVILKNLMFWSPKIVNFTKTSRFTPLRG